MAKKNKIITSSSTPTVTVDVDMVVPEEMTESVEVVEDRSAYNCTRCGGLGLAPHGVAQIICPDCNGTGKI